MGTCCRVQRFTSAYGVLLPPSVKLASRSKRIQSTTSHLAYLFIDVPLITEPKRSAATHAHGLIISIHVVHSVATTNRFKSGPRHCLSVYTHTHTHTYTITITCHQARHVCQQATSRSFLLAALSLPIFFAYCWASSNDIVLGRDGALCLILSTTPSKTCSASSLDR